jgi:hypothetical protein
VELGGADASIVGDAGAPPDAAIADAHVETMDSGVPSDAAVPDTDAGGLPSDAGYGWDFGPLYEDAGMLELDSGLQGFKVTIQFSGTGGGSVVVGNLHCERDCTLQLAPGASTVTATALPGSHFVGWSGAGCGTAASCDFTLSGELSLTATFAGDTNLAFVTSEEFVAYSIGTYPAGGPVIGDALCGRAARRANLPGNYVGWLSSPSSAAFQRLGPAEGWLRMDGRPFMPHYRDPYPLFFSLSIDEYGRDIGTVPLFTSTNIDGTLNDLDGTQVLGGAGACEHASERAWFGMSDEGWGVWTGTYTPLCTTSGHLACLQRDLVATVAPPPVPSGAKRAFVTRPSAIDVLYGTPYFDRSCQEAAVAAGWAGTYVAWVADLGVSAPERAALTPSTWFRPDGVVIIDNDVPENPWSAHLDVHSTGEYDMQGVATGALHVHDPGTPETTCRGWTSFSPTDTFAATWMSRGPNRYFREQPADFWPCTHGIPTLWCFQR